MAGSGNPEVVLMAITGHKTMAVFERCDIVNETGLRLAASWKEEYLKTATGTKTGTIVNISDRHGIWSGSR